MSDDNKVLLGDRYQIVRRLSSGGSGHVYLAEDMTKVAGDNLCAVKELDPKTRDPEEHEIFCERFKDEATYLRALDGFNGQIPKLYEYFSAVDGNSKETNYIVQEYIEGKTLKEKIREEGRLNESTVEKLLASLLPVIAHIHSKGFIHRDINPANIILRQRDESPVLIDFGAVKDMETTLIASAKDSDPLTVVIGKTGYMAPEHLAGRPVFASDLYSLGITAIEALLGMRLREIHRDPSTNAILWIQRVPDLSLEFAAVIDRAVQDHAETRYGGDARAMLKALESAASRESENNFGQQPGDSLHSLLERQPKPFSGYPKKCWAKACNYYVASQDKYCSNCGAFNLYQFTKPEIHLMCNSVEAHLERIYPHASQSTIVQISKLIMDNTESFAIIAGLGALFGLIISLAVGRVAQGGVFAFVSALIEYGWLSLFGAVVIWVLMAGVIWLLLKLILFNDTARLRNYNLKKDELLKKLHTITASYQKSGSYLKVIEKETSAQITIISKREKGITERLSHTRRAADENVGESELQNELENLKSALAKSKQKQKKYEVKLLEIELLRLHSNLQGTTNRRIMTQDARSTVETRLGELIRLLNRMLGDLKEASLLNSRDGKEWVARIHRAKEIVAESRNLLIKQINDLCLLDRESEPITPSEEFVKNLDLLNAYLNYDDFSKEYQALKSE